MNRIVSGLRVGIPFYVKFSLVICLTSGLVFAENEKTESSLPFQYPMVVGHRGASGILPEHTLESYQMAINFGADFIEPDVVSTKDGVLVIRHDIEIGETTNVADKFPDRKSERMIDGIRVVGWFVDDFSLAELREITARQRVPTRDQNFNDKFQIPTLEEVIQLVLKASINRGGPVGIYIETKHPSYFQAHGLKLEDKIVALLNKYDLNCRSAPVIIQSFEPSNLRELHAKTPVRKMQLIGEVEKRPFDFTINGDLRTYGDLLKPAGLKEISEYADAIGPAKQHILPPLPDGSLKAPTELVNDAHAVGLEVHPYTFKQDPGIVPQSFDGDLATEMGVYFSLGADAIFSDWPNVAVQAKRQYLYNKKRLALQAESVRPTPPELEVSVFDFDDTLMATEARLYLYHKTSEQELGVSTAQFALFGRLGHFSDYTLKNPVDEFSFREIYDQEGRNQFLDQVENAVTVKQPSEWQAPAWNIFKQNMVRNPENQYILTARNHSPKQMHEGLVALASLGKIPSSPKQENILVVGYPKARTAGMDIPEAKLFELRDIARSLDAKAAQANKKGLFRFYDDKYATFEHVWSTFAKELENYPHLEFQIEYVGYYQPKTPFSTAHLERGREPRLIQHWAAEDSNLERSSEGSGLKSLETGHLQCVEALSSPL